MLNAIYLCIANEHDIRLVALGAFICVFGCFTAVNLFTHAREAAGQHRLALMSAAAVVFAAGVWATHFVAELAFKPGLPIAYDFDLTALSMVVAVLLTAAGMVVALYLGRPVAGGVVVGAAVAAMHYTGMAALRAPADVEWHAAYVVLSLVVAGIGGGAAFWALCRGPAWRYRLAATALLVLAICGLHFSGMTAITLVLNPLVAIPEKVVAPEVLAILVAAVSLGIGLVGMSLSIFEEQSARRATHEAEELRLSREHLARAQRISGVGSVVRNLRTGVTECSDEFYRIFGVDRGSFDPSVENVMSLVHPDDRDAAHTAQVAANASRIEAAPREYRIVRPDGEVRVVYREMELSFDEAGWPLQRIVTFKDITDLRAAQDREHELQRQLMHQQKLQALGTLAGGIAHELNNSLVPVLALAKVVRDDLPGDDPLRDDVEMIIEASERARDLVKQILAHSRRDDLGRQEVDLAALTSDALDSLRKTFPPTVHIVEELEASQPVPGDPDELRQVVVNLVNNAAQALGAEPGTITVSVGMAGDSARVAVTDTGCGMDGATIDRIFEPFFTTKTVGDGTGLGLSVVHWIVTGHRGRIDVHSKPGEGSVFTVLLPAVGALATTA